jgi:hypothetical protein
MADVQRPMRAGAAGGGVRRVARWGAALVAGSSLVLSASPVSAAEHSAPVSGVRHAGPLDVFAPDGLDRMTTPLGLGEVGVVKALDDLVAGSAAGLVPGQAPDQTSATGSDAPYPVLADDQGERPVIAPGEAGQVTVGLRNTGNADAVNDGRMYMELWAPYYARFTDVTLTPVDGALGGWACTGDGGVEGKPYESTVLRCSSSEKGVVARPGQAVHWRANIKVNGDAPADTLLHNAGEGGYGAVLYHISNGRGHWSTMSLTVMTAHAS